MRARRRRLGSTWRIFLPSRATSHTTAEDVTSAWFSPRHTCGEISAVLTQPQAQQLTRPRQSRVSHATGALLSCDEGGASTFLGAIELRSFAIDATPRATSTRATNVLCGSVHCPRTRATCFFLSLMCAPSHLARVVDLADFSSRATSHHGATAPSSAHGRAVVLSTAHLRGDQRGSARRDSS